MVGWFTGPDPAQCESASRPLALKIVENPVGGWPRITDLRALFRGRVGRPSKAPVRPGPHAIACTLTTTRKIRPSRSFESTAITSATRSRNSGNRVRRAIKMTTGIGGSATFAVTRILD